MTSPTCGCIVQSGESSQRHLLCDKATNRERCAAVPPLTVLLGHVTADVDLFPSSLSSHGGVRESRGWSNHRRSSLLSPSRHLHAGLYPPSAEISQTHRRLLELPAMADRGVELSALPKEVRDQLAELDLELSEGKTALPRGGCAAGVVLPLDLDTTGNPPRRLTELFFFFFKPSPFATFSY